MSAEMSSSSAAPADFMAGVALMDDMLRETDRRSTHVGDDERLAETVWLEADCRRGEPLSLYLKPFLARLLSRPELADGFAAALGDYLGRLHQDCPPVDGALYTKLSYEDCVGPDLPATEPGRRLKVEESAAAGPSDQHPPGNVETADEATASDPFHDMAAHLFEQIATLANTLDRECYWAHSDRVEDREPERVQQELNRLRAALCQIGWMADLGHRHLTGYEEVRGGAEDWLLSPAYRELRRAAQSKGGAA